MVNDEQAKLSVRCLLFIVYRLLLLWAEFNLQMQQNSD